MNHQILVITIFVMGALFLSISMGSRRNKRTSVFEFFLASRSLRPSRVTSMLVSGSFSLNGMLYQIVLGYQIGLWALLPQVAWAASFLWLTQYAPRLVGSDGLHDFLGRAFSRNTRVIAAMCSILGLSLQIGWEYNVAKSAFSSITVPHLNSVATVIIVSIVFMFAAIYTLIGGLRSNSTTDLVENVIKGGCFLFIGVLAWLTFAQRPHVSVPSFASALEVFGPSALLANLLFSVVWQFVDMTTWQTAVSTARERGAEGVRKSLRDASIWVFVAPGLLGTIVGIGLSGNPGLDPNNIFSALLSAHQSVIITIILTVALVATVMSFVDGMLLGIGYTFMTDLVFRSKVEKYHLLEQPGASRAEDLGYRAASASVMAGTRLTLIVAAVCGTLVLDFLSVQFRLNVFDQVYLVTVSQLALFGPVICGLLGRTGSPGVGPLAIGGGAMVGFGMIAAGWVTSSSDCTNLAPVGTLLISAVTAFLGSRSMTTGGLGTTGEGGSRT